MLLAAILALAALPVVAGAAPSQRLRGYHQRNLVSDQAGRAAITDPNLVNAWGLAFGPTTPAWVANNGTGTATLYRGATSSRSGVTRLPLVVKIPQGAPTGTVFNGGREFVVRSGMASGPALFLFASEKGVISGWNPNVPAANSTDAQVAATVPGAVFKGLAIAHTSRGPRLYATDFHSARVDVWDGSFSPVRRAGAFTDRRIPSGFAPFGIQTVARRFVVVTYAKQDAAKMDDVKGPGLGFVDLYDTNGHLVRRLASHGPLNAPWGIAPAPRHFGPAGGDLLIGNFGDGRINALNERRGRFDGALLDARGRKLTIDGLWSLQFGNGVIGNSRTLLFTAGPNGEMHGLFGTITHR